MTRKIHGRYFVAPESRSARRGSRIPATGRLTMFKRESPLVVVPFYSARSTEDLGGRAATGEPGPPFKPVGRPAPTGLGSFSTCERSTSLVMHVHRMGRQRCWRAAFSRAMTRFSTSKANYLTSATDVTIVGSNTSSITRRLNHIYLHRCRSH